LTATLKQRKINKPTHLCPHTHLSHKQGIFINLLHKSFPLSQFTSKKKEPHEYFVKPGNLSSAGNEKKGMRSPPLYHICDMRNFLIKIKKKSGGSLPQNPKIAKMSVKK